MRAGKSLGTKVMPLSLQGYKLDGTMVHYHARRLLGGWTVALACLVIVLGNPSVQASSSSPLILRVRLQDGTMERIVVSDQNQPLQQVLSSAIDMKEDSEIIVTNKQQQQPLDLSSSPSSLQLSNGALLTVQSAKAKPTSGLTQKKRKVEDEDVWHPFPDLAKSYHATKRRQQLLNQQRTSRSYGDLAHLQSQLHVVTPQPESVLKRIYMCSVSAERFYTASQQQNTATSTNGENPKKTSFTPSYGLLLGTISRERVDPSRKPKAKTSLSSTTSDEEYCQVAKVHAVWQVPTAVAGKAKSKKQKSTSTDPTQLLQDAIQSSTEGKTPIQRVARVARALGLQPVGWIFTYADDRHGNDGLPVFGKDVVTGAHLQMAKMKSQSPDAMSPEHSRAFVTLAMEASTGATEAFQLSDVSVQMVSEKVFDTSGRQNERFTATQHPVIVDGQETHQVDSVLCLVNTAMLSKQGDYCGPTKASVKKTGALTKKTRKALLDALAHDTAQTTSSSQLLPLLCDFDLLLSLDEFLGPKDSEQVCAIVQKWARGQKRKTQLDDRLLQRIRQFVEH